jgi:tetratricopeptide (TPR) repeat protein
LIIRRLPLVKDRIFLDLFEKCRLSLGIRKNITVIVTDNVKSPALFGYFKPRLLLPAHFLETLQRDELRYVFLHELSHLKRHDIVVSWFVTVLQIIHWFNPFVWYAFYHLRVDQEAACDAYVLSRIKQVQPADYANTIVSLLERFIQNRQLPSLVGIIENRSQIRRRIAMIINFKEYTLQRKCASILMLFIIGLLFFTSSSGKADVKNPEIAVDNKEIQLNGSIDEKVSSRYENRVSPSENVMEYNEEIDIVASNEMVKGTGIKGEADITLARVDTKDVMTQADPMILAADQKQEVLSENKTPETEEPEESVEPSEAVQQEQDPSLDYTSQGLSHLKKGQIDDAVSAFNRAIELNPGNSVAYFSRGRAYYRQGKMDNAISDYNRAIEISPEFTAAYQNRGYAYYSIDNYEKAISDYDRAIAINPEDAETYNMRGIAYFKQDKIEKAVSDYNKALEISPEFAAAYQNRGYVHHSKGNYLKAISDYDKAIEYNPENAETYNMRAIAYFKQDKIENAISDYDKAIEFDPENANLYLCRGHIYLSRRLYDKAISDYSKTIELSPEDVNAYFSRGLIYFSKGKMRKARSEFDKALDLNPEAALAKVVKEYRNLTIYGRYNNAGHIPMGINNGMSYEAFQAQLLKSYDRVN